MKTSILISSIAALCLVGTFAVAPRHHGEDNISMTSTDNISFVSAGSATMLTGVVITPEINQAEEISIPVIPVEDLNYLTFEVTEYMEADAINPDETEILPEVEESDLSYLKFNISDYMSDSEIPGDAITVLPLSEEITSAPEPFLTEFEYLRFDVNDYINPSATEAAGIGELPLKETNDPSGISVTPEIPLEFGYLKFDVTRYSSETLTQGEAFELPEK